MKKKVKKTKSAKPVKRPKAKRSKAKRPGALRPVNIKLNAQDRKALSARAKRFAKGNLSAFLRHTGLKYVPKKGEVIQAYAKPPRK